MTRFVLPTGLEIVLAPTAMATLITHRQRSGELEAGGILLGRIFPERHIIVERVTAPNPADRAGPTFFHRDAAVAQEMIDQAWIDSQGVQIYLGEWHTHSVPFPRPSLQDRRMIRGMLRDTRMDIDFLILIIVGQDAYWVGLDNGDALLEAALCVSDS